MFPRLALRWGIAARQPKKVPLRFTSRMSSQTCAVIPSRSVCGMKWVVPALLTSTSSPPSSRADRSTIARTAASSATLAATTRTFAPRWRTPSAVSSASAFDRE